MLHALDIAYVGKTTNKSRHNCIYLNVILLAGAFFNAHNTYSTFAKTINFFTREINNSKNAEQFYEASLIFWASYLSLFFSLNDA